MVANGYSTAKESEAAAIDNKDDDNGFFFNARGIVQHEFFLQGQMVNQEVYISILRRMREALRRHRPELWASGQWTLLHDNARPHTALSDSRFLTKHNVTVLSHPRYISNVSVAVLPSFTQNLMLTRCSTRTSILLTAKIATGKGHRVSRRVLPPSGGRAN